MRLTRMAAVVCVWLLVVACAGPTAGPPAGSAGGAAPAASKPAGAGAGAGAEAAAVAAPGAASGAAAGSAAAPAASAGAPAAKPAGPPVKVQTCIPARGDTILPIFAAADGGYLEQQNIETDIHFFAGGAVDQAFVAGQCDFIFGAGAIGPLLAGADVVAVAVTINTLPGEVWARPPARTMEDLRGKTLGTTGAGSLSWRVGRYTLQINGLTPETDVAVMALGDTNATIGALLVGRVDSALLFSPYNFQARKEGMTRVYAPPPSIAFMNTALVTSRRYLNANPDVVRRMVKGVTEAIVRIKDDEVFYGEKLERFNSLTLDPATRREYWEANAPTYAIPPRVSPEGAVLALQLYAERAPDAAMEELARGWLDMQFVDELYPR